MAAALGYAHAVAGRGEEALTLLNLANERARAVGLISRSMTGVHSIQGYLLIGKPEEAASLASRALESSRLHSQRSREALARYVLGEITLLFAPTDFNKAEENFGQAIALGD